jgi:hypothetical protein
VMILTKPVGWVMKTKILVEYKLEGEDHLGKPYGV